MNTSIDFKDAKVLIVDDQRAFHITLKGMLLNMGVKDTQFVESADAAIRACRSNSFDIILADYNLGPGKNGQQLLEALRTARYISPNTIFFIISGESTRIVVLGALEREPDDYLVKPFSLKQLATRLKRSYIKHQELAHLYTAIYNRDLDTGITLCKQYIADDSRYKALCTKILSELYRRTGEVEKSEQILRAILEQRDLVWARVQMGHTLNAAKRPKEAIEIVKPVLKMSPLTVEAKDCLADAYVSIDDHVKALEMLCRAADTSPFRPERQVKLAEMALRNDEFTIAQEAFKQVFEQSRKADEGKIEHLCNYIRSAMDASIREDDPNKAKRLESEAFNSLMRARQDGQYQGFDFKNFSDLVSATALAHKGELIRAKKLYYKATESYDHESEDNQMPEEFLPEGLKTSSIIGELEEANLILERAQKLNPTNPFLKSAITLEQSQESGLQRRHETFQIHNKAGMEAYDKNEYMNAITEFEQALRLAPTNTGAALNLIQTLLKNLQSSKKLSTGQIKRCEDLFKLVDVVRLPPQHRARRKDLWSQFQQIQHKLR